jgi:hypothetical protein
MSSKFNWEQSLFDSVKMYINPIAFQKEMLARGDLDWIDDLDETEINKIKFNTGQGGKYNHEFEQHSRTARMTGKPVLSKDMQEAIESGHEMRKTGKKPDEVLIIKDINAPLDSNNVTIQKPEDELTDPDDYDPEETELG